MANQLEICNLALLQLGGETITAMTEASRSARALSAVWTTVLKDVLRDHNWNFAKKRATLSVTTAPLYGFANAFTLPTDCLKVVCLGEPEDELTWRIEGNLLLTDEGTAQILYIRYVGTDTGAGPSDETGLYDSKFVLALAYRLAAEVAEAITGRTGRREEMLKLYQMVRDDAATVGSQEQAPEAMSASSWITARA